MEMCIKTCYRLTLLCKPPETDWIEQPTFDQSVRLMSILIKAACSIGADNTETVYEYLNLVMTGFNAPFQSQNRLEGLVLSPDNPRDWHQATCTCLHCFSDCLVSCTVQLPAAKALDELLQDLTIRLQAPFHSLVHQSLPLLNVPASCHMTISMRRRQKGKRCHDGLAAFALLPAWRVKSATSIVDMAIEVQASMMTVFPKCRQDAVCQISHCVECWRMTECEQAPFEMSACMTNGFKAPHLGSVYGRCGSHIECIRAMILWRPVSCILGCQKKTTAGKVSDTSAPADDLSWAPMMCNFATA